MTTDEIIEVLLEIGAPARLVAEISRRLFTAEANDTALAAARAVSRQSSQRYRDKKSSVTSRDVTSGHVTSPPPVIDPPKEKKGKNPSSTAHPLPPEFQLNDADHEFAHKRGWDEWRRKDEFQRFQDHAQATGRRLTDWRAGWRTWVMSPYNNPKPGAAINGHRRETTAEQGRRLAAQLGRQMQGENGSRGGNEGSDPDVVSLPRDKYGLV